MAECRGGCGRTVHRMNFTDIEHEGDCLAGKLAVLTAKLEVGDCGYHFSMCQSGHVYASAEDDNNCPLCKLDSVTRERDTTYKLRDTLFSEISDLEAERDKLKALVGTIRDLTGCETRNVDDITPEQHSHEIMAQFNALSSRLDEIAKLVDACDGSAADGDRFNRITRLCRVVEKLNPFAPQKPQGEVVNPHVVLQGPIIARCPKCGAEQEDQDGLGVLHCVSCGYCTHAAVNGKLCMLCGKQP